MIVAFDLSSTATGVCAGGETHTIAPPKGPLIERARFTRQEVRHLLVPTPELVVIEGVGTRHVQTAIAIATVHALVLDEIVGYCPLLVVSPAELKKWAVGKGGGKGTDKDALLIAAMRAHPDNDIDSNDECDAWWLWTLAEAMHGRWHVQETGYRVDVLKGLTP